MKRAIGSQQTHNVLRRNRLAFLERDDLDGHCCRRNRLTEVSADRTVIVTGWNRVCLLGLLRFAFPYFCTRMLVTRSAFPVALPFARHMIVTMRMAIYAKQALSQLETDYEEDNQWMEATSHVSALPSKLEDLIGYQPACCKEPARGRGALLLRKRANRVHQHSYEKTSAGRRIPFVHIAGKDPLEK
jgi:hypothetical protein